MGTVADAILQSTDAFGIKADTYFWDRLDLKLGTGGQNNAKLTLR